MKTLSIVICAGLFIVACVGSASGRGTDELLVSLRLTTGERSKDSGSQTTTITVERDAIAILIEELYRIMNGHDKSVHFEELILDRTGR